jgi:seryl-tRNA synthetase
MSDAASQFRDELLDDGLLIDTGIAGLYGRSATFERVIDGINNLASDAGAFHQATVVRFPPVMSRALFEKTGYLRSFPDLTGSVHTFHGDNKAHVEVLRLLDAGEDWAGALSPTEVMLVPAACHPLYPMCAGRLPEGGRVFDVFGYTFRHEPSVEPTRMIAFRMREFVYVGEPDAAQAHRDDWVKRAVELMSGLGLPVEAVVASDPFFGRLGTMLAANQRDEELKYEIVTAINSAEHPTAIMSSNCHRDHFGDAFAIETADGGVAHSSCVGFGMERIALALFRNHGFDPDQWPARVKDRLWP